jgi:hypothetical protein
LFKEDKDSFFEKKKQKTFAAWLRAAGTAVNQRSKSLFASFSSEKEDLTYL